MAPLQEASDCCNVARVTVPSTSSVLGCAVTGVNTTLQSHSTPMPHPVSRSIIRLCGFLLGKPNPKRLSTGVFFYQYSYSRLLMTRKETSRDASSTTSAALAATAVPIKSGTGRGWWRQRWGLWALVSRRLSGICQGLLRVEVTNAQKLQHQPLYRPKFSTLEVMVGPPDRRCESWDTVWEL